MHFYYRNFAFFLYDDRIQEYMYRKGSKERENDWIMKERERRRGVE
jgi:hypothetical protein